MPPRPLIPLDQLDLDRVLADVDAIREHNPQRFEMEQLTRIIHFVREKEEVAGVLEIGDEPFWARGHVPAYPLMPGVMMLEAAAQLCSWAVRQVYDKEEYGHRFFGFGAIDDVKFRGIVRPGDALLLLGRAIEHRARRAVFATQGFVEGRMVFQANITGMWLL